MVGCSLATATAAVGSYAGTQDDSRNRTPHL